MLDRQGELPHWLAPYQLQQPSTPVSDIEGALKLMQPDVQTLGFELQRQFGIVNFRGIRSYNVETRRNTDSISQSYKSDLGIETPGRSMLLWTDLAPEELLTAGPALSYFWNQVGLDKESQMRGFLVLQNYNANVEDSRGIIEVGYVQKDENKQSFGVRFENLNNAVKFIHGEKMDDEDRIKMLDELFEDLTMARSGKITHPLFAHGMYDAAFLMGKSIWNRRIKSDFFEQSES